MANCVYYAKNGFGNGGCTSREHPNYSNRISCASFDNKVPAQCAKGGKGCPILKKEQKK